MARTALTTQAVTPSGVAIALTAANADGNSVDVGDGYTLVVRNDDASSKTVTVQTPHQVEGVDVAEVTLAVPAGEVGFVALDSQLFRRRSSTDAGKAYVDYSAVTSVTVAVIQS